ncbi:MAG: hypothetical protein ACMXYB_04805 [Candidatus Woesearchaeota archaeon]
MTSTTIDISPSSYSALKLIAKEEKEISTLLDSIILEYIDDKIDAYLESLNTISIEDAILDVKKNWQ